MVAIGCGADQNPEPRGTMRMVEEYGREIAVEVDRLLAGKLEPISSVPECRYKLVDLPLGELPTEADLKKRLEGKVERVRYYAGIMLERMARGEKLPGSFPYAVQTWNFGEDLGMVFLAGEVVVDYGLRLKRELDASRLWVNGYSNDVPCYIASARVIGEGGYEVDQSMDSYDKATRLDPKAEDMIVEAVHELMPKAFVERREIRADVAQDFWRELNLPKVKALTPEEAVADFRLPPGFRVEVVAAEPLVEDPVTCVWDADGRLWVVEMLSYMLTPEGEGENEPTSRVVVLEDTDGDGKMDKRTVFLDGLVMPRAIAFVEGGVLIGEPPTLWFCQDMNGDLVCDKKRSVYESYGQRDAVSRTASGLVLGIDNWMVNTRLPERFQFRNGKLVTAPDAYRGDFGLAQDDYGRIYANVNASWLHADLVPFRYMARHPNLLGPVGIYERVVQNQAVHTIRVNPGVVAGHTVGMLRDDGRLAITTAATSPTIYRGDRYPAEFYGNAFVPEPAGNVVGRFKLMESGTGLEAEHVLTPDPDWEQREFLSSTDERFRPVQATVGPDGCLYVVDFYRGVIEYKLFMNTYLREQIIERGLLGPPGLGRIYRIVCDGMDPGPAPHLGNANAEELVGALSHPVGWWKDTAQRLLVERGGVEAVKALRALAIEGENPLGRLHALWTLEGMSAVDLETVLTSMTDKDAKVRAAAMRVGEGFVGDARYRIAVMERGSDSDIGVQLQALFSLGEMHGDAEALAMMGAILVTHAENAHFRHGAISGVAGRELAFLGALGEVDEFGVRPMGGRGVFLRELATVIFRQRRPESAEALLARIAREENTGVKVNLLEGIARASKKGRPLLLSSKPEVLDLLQESAAPEVVKAGAMVAKLLTWPGDTTKEVTLEEARPLNASEQKQFELGRSVYQGLCIACHQMNGRGMPSLAPPLVDSPWALGSEERLIRIILQGIYGPMVLNNVEWNLVMPGQKDNPLLDDEKIAAVLTYIRREWEHGAEPVSVEAVNRVREETKAREVPWTVRELEEIQ